MTTSAVIRVIGDGLSRVSSVSGTAGYAVPEWRSATAVKNAALKGIKAFRNWQHRRHTIETLSMLSDHHLNDIGIQRADISRIAREMTQGRKQS